MMFNMQLKCICSPLKPVLHLSWCYPNTALQPLPLLSRPSHRSNSFLTITSHPSPYHYHFPTPHTSPPFSPPHYSLISLSPHLALWDR